MSNYKWHRYKTKHSYSSVNNWLREAVKLRRYEHTLKSKQHFIGVQCTLYHSLLHLFTLINSSIIISNHNNRCIMVEKRENCSAEISLLFELVISTQHELASRAIWQTPWNNKKKSLIKLFIIVSNKRLINWATLKRLV